MTPLLAETRWFKKDSQKLTPVYTRITRSKRACSSIRSTNSKRRRHLSVIETPDNKIASERLQITYPGVGNNSQFTYDGYGHTVKAIEVRGGTTTSTKQFIWCEGSMCEARDASSNLLNQYFPLGQTISGSNYYYLFDHLGSIIALIDSSGNVVAAYIYDPYGRVMQTQGSLASDFQYAGYYYHAPSGLSLAVHRAYNASIGRWMNRDPIGEYGGLNLYGYVENEPISGTDSSGLFEWVIPIEPIEMPIEPIEQPIETPVEGPIRGPVQGPSGEPLNPINNPQFPDRREPCPNLHDKCIRKCNSKYSPWTKQYKDCIDDCNKKYGGDTPHPNPPQYPPRPWPPWLPRKPVAA